jgi:hypothetical protein
VKDLAKAIKNEIKESLGNVPSWVADRVQAFCASMLPFPKKQRSSREGTAVEKIAPAFTVAAYEELPDELEDAFQSFYELLEEQLKADNSATGLRIWEDKQNDESSVNKEKAQQEGKVREILERVERTLCSVFYDR